MRRLRSLRVPLLILTAFALTGVAGLSGGLGQIFDQWFLLTRNQVPGFSQIVVAGQNPDVDTGSLPEDVWGAGGQLVYPTVATTLEVVSSSTSDTSAGVGARSVIVNCLAADWTILPQETVPTNGTTPVVTTTSCYRVNPPFRVLTAGSSNTNVGDITLRISGGGATQRTILAGQGQALAAHFSVPAGRTAYVTDTLIGIGRGGGLDVSLDVAPFRRTNLGPWFLENNYPVNSGGSNVTTVSPRLISSYPEKTDIRWTVVGVTSNDVRALVTLHLALEVN